VSTHTPGPWWWDGKPGESNLRCGDAEQCETDGSVLRYAPYEGMWFSRYGSDIEDAANARLIAAAPELLAALERAADALEAVSQDHEVIDARATIAKAKGESA
jgi:hypothetical protein